jgi:hypothetical protein
MYERLLLFLIGTAAIVEHPAWSRRGRPLSDRIPDSGYGLTAGSLVRKFMSRMGLGCVKSRFGTFYTVRVISGR